MAVTPLDEAVAGQSDGTGAIFWRTNFLAVGEAAILGLYVPDAPVTATGTVYVAGAPQMSFGLALGLSGLRIENGPLEVRGSGLVATTPYQLTIKGAVGPREEVPPSAPLPSPSQPAPAPAANPTVTRFPAAVVDAQILAANPNRTFFTIEVDDGASDLKFVYGPGPASATNYSVELAGSASEYFEDPTGWTGELHGIWDGTIGAASVTEWAKP